MLMVWDIGGHDAFDASMRTCREGLGLGVWGEG